MNNTNLGGPPEDDRDFLFQKYLDEGKRCRKGKSLIETSTIRLSQMAYENFTKDQKDQISLRKKYQHLYSQM